MRRPPALENSSLELSRMLLDSAARLHGAGDLRKAREAFEKAQMIYHAAAPAEPPRFARKFAELGALLGVPAKPAGRETRRPRARNAGA